MYTNVQNRILKKIKSDYRVEPAVGKHKGKLEVLRKNPKGFLNTAGIIDNISELDDFILEDYQSLKKKQKIITKSNESEDDI